MRPHRVVVSDKEGPKRRGYVVADEEGVRLGEYQEATVFESREAALAAAEPLAGEGKHVFTHAVERRSDYDEGFQQRVREARENGVGLVCAHCGHGMDEDEFADEDAHEYGCPNRGRDLHAEQMEYLQGVLGPERFAEAVQKATEEPRG